jgi:hypothetical protein
MHSTSYMRGVQEMPGIPMQPPVPLPQIHGNAHCCGEGQASVGGKTDQGDFIYRQGRRQILGDEQPDRSRLSLSAARIIEGEPLGPSSRSQRARMVLVARITVTLFGSFPGARRPPAATSTSWSSARPGPAPRRGRRPSARLPPEPDGSPRTLSRSWTTTSRRSEAGPPPGPRLAGTSRMACGATASCWPAPASTSSGKRPYPLAVTSATRSLPSTPGLTWRRPQPGLKPRRTTSEPGDGTWRPGAPSPQASPLRSPGSAGTAD